MVFIQPETVICRYHHAPIHGIPVGVRRVTTLAIMRVVNRPYSTVNQLLLGWLVQFEISDVIASFHGGSCNDGPVHPLALALVEKK